MSQAKKEKEREEAYKKFLVDLEIVLSMFSRQMVSHHLLINPKTIGHWVRRDKVARDSSVRKFYECYGRTVWR